MKKKRLSNALAAEQGEASMRESLLQAFRHSQAPGQFSTEGLADLFSDMAYNKRWTICIENKDDALAFSALLALNITLLQSDPDRWSPARRERAPWILKIVNEWLAPDRPHYVLPSVNHFARALFGDAWGDLVLSDTVQEWEIHTFIKQNRPEFQAHMVPYVPDIAVGLPELDSP